MKKSSLLVWLVVAAVLSSLATRYVVPSHPPAGQPDVQKVASDATYDRIMQSGKVVCGYFPWPGGAEKDPNTGKVSGLVVDLVEQALATLDLKVQWQEVVIGTQVQDLNTGKIDALCNDGPWVMSAGKHVEFSDPMVATILLPYIRVDDSRFSAMADLNNPSVRFVGLDGDASVELAQRRFPKAQLKSLPGTTDLSQLFLDVATGKADILITDPHSFDAFEKNNPGKVKPFLPAKPVGLYKMVFSVAKGNMKTLGLLNQAVDNAAAFGITEQVLNKHDPDHRTLKRVRSIYED
ncbi:MAG: transporter substrate-binding domain-containing protein [Alphaproteobacteria bacterium]|nr:transporter substrate-binding domain-containing protein [Alphaproteobacteria bacterium]